MNSFCDKSGNCWCVEMNYDNLHIDAMFVVLLIGRAQQHSCKGWTHQRGRQNFTGGKRFILLHTFTHAHSQFCILYFKFNKENITTSYCIVLCV